MTLKKNFLVRFYSLINDMKDYNLKVETIVKLYDIDENYLVQLLNKDLDCLPSKVKYHISIFLLNLEQAINKL